MLREPQKMFVVLGGSATSVVRCGLVSVTTPLTLDIATKAYMNCEERDLDAEASHLNCA